MPGGYTRAVTRRGEEKAPGKAVRAPGSQSGAAEQSTSFTRDRLEMQTLGHHGLTELETLTGSSAVSPHKPPRKSGSCSI